MLLLQARVVGVGPFRDLTFKFSDAETAAPRKLVIVVGGGGVGKTSLLAALASTRPGNTSVQPRSRAAPAVAAPSFVVAEWALGMDETARPHALRVASPNAALDEPEAEATLHRREQTHFDRRAAEGGFVFLSFSGARWFSRSPVLLTTPERTVARYDVRSTGSFDDATRADLARETKTALSYSAVAAALVRSAGGERPDSPAEAFERAMHGAIAPLAALAGVAFVGADPMTLEPIFEVTENGARVSFDDLPTHARHLVSFAALTVRALYAAYPGRDPRLCEGVVFVDDVDLHQDAHIRRAIASSLRQALPNVQWILTTSSPEVTHGCAATDVLALRRMPNARDVILYEGELALLH